MTPSSVVYGLAGSPAVAGTVPRSGRCAICAAAITEGVPYSEWQGGNFTNQTDLRDISADSVCPACVWCSSWVAPPGYVPSEEAAAKNAAKRAAKVAEAAAKGKTAMKEKGVMLRLFSHLWSEGGGYRFENKATKPQILAWLRAPKQGAWFAAIADTGQKQVLPFMPMNPAGAHRGFVRYEESTLVLGDFALVDAMTDLLTHGATKEEIADAGYSPLRWVALGPQIMAFEERWGRARGSRWFDLALWLAQRDEEEFKRRFDARQERGAPARGAAPDGGKKRVPGQRRQPAQALGSAPEPDALGGADERKRGRVGNGARQGAPAQADQQGTLFGNG